MRWFEGFTVSGKSADGKSVPFAGCRGDAPRAVLRRYNGCFSREIAFERNGRIKNKNRQQSCRTDDRSFEDFDYTSFRAVNIFFFFFQTSRHGTFFFLSRKCIFQLKDLSLHTFFTHSKLSCDKLKTELRSLKFFYNYWFW